ncbi:MAG: carbon-nitrogen hydrolase family protein [Desulforhopalus sp.]
MSRMLGVGACQMDVMTGNTDDNLANLRAQIKLIKLYSPWVKLIVAPELCFYGVSDFRKSAEPIPGVLTKRCGEIAAEFGVFLVAGSLFEKDGDLFYNTTPVFDGDGEIVDTYRKMYPWRPHEKVTSGNRTVVFDIPEVGRVGICICYDLWFPELIRDLVVKGAEIIVIPTLSGTQDRRQEILLSQAAAIQNQCYIVGVNGVGGGGIGGSLIVDPEGVVVQQAGQVKENLISMLDLDHVQSIRDHGVAGVSRPLASFLHEDHSFSYQQQSLHKGNVYARNILIK